MSGLTERNVPKNIFCILVFVGFAASISYFLLTTCLNRIVHSYDSENFPTVQGQVQTMELTGSGWKGKEPEPSFKKLEVQFHWEDKNYTASNPGFYFTWAKYKEAEKTGECTVHVNQKNPNLSILSVGVSSDYYIILSIFSLAALTFAYGAVYIAYITFFKKYEPAAEAADES